MDTLLKTTQAAVTNVCHEMANHMNIIKFLQEDIIEEFKHGALAEESLARLFDNIDNTILSMDFFRNLYSLSDSKNEILKIALKMCEKKDIKVSNFTTQFEDSLASPRVEKALAAILFLLTKMNNNKVCIMFSTIEKTVIVDVRGCTGEPQRRLIKMLGADTNEGDKDAFTIIAYYLKKLLSFDKLSLKTDNKIVDNLRIKICK